MAYPRLTWPVERLVYAIWAGVVRVDFVGFKMEPDVFEEVELIEEMRESKEWVRFDLRDLGRYCAQKGDRSYNLSGDAAGTLECHSNIAEWEVCKADGGEDCRIIV